VAELNSLAIFAEVVEAHGLPEAAPRGAKPTYFGPHNPLLR